ncbi:MULTISPECIES: ABC transporter permease [unclassified Nocardiopsis]|uniref:ABC transporter permease n=1 Tax=unclassified Nocardiopsis TaxID=2649073 RepID=UPI001356B790|nr:MULTISPECIES: ABC transporter permease [unclassified Nocardiopsis]
MITYSVKRLLSGAALLAVLSVITFFALRLGTQGVAQQIAGQSAGPEAVALIEERYGLDRPLAQQFLSWAASALTGDLGRSWFTGQPVTEAVLSRLAVTVNLAVGSVALTGALGVLLGALAATRRGWPDRLVQVLSVLGQAVPGFVLAVGLVLLFAVQLRWFPATGYTDPSDSVGGWIRSLTLPVLALAVGSVGGVAQQVRGSMLDVLRRDHVRTLRSRGLPRRRVLYRYVLRNAAGPALSVLGLQFVIILSAAVVVEQVFSIPGLGPVALTSTARGDAPLVMGVVLVTGALVVLVNLLVDLLQAFLNPKVRLS